MKKVLLGAIMSLGTYCGWSQELPKIIPPAPEAASFAKFTEVPVTLNNGAAYVSIPIHTVEVKGISIPISLNYHTRGVKVDEIASRTGLGWALNYGGMISRTALGRPDDAGPWAYLNRNYATDLASNTLTQQAVFNDYCSSNGELDLESDVFHLSAGGVSGKFFFEQSDKINPVLKEFDDIKVTATWDQGIIVAFTVIDKLGNTYYFGKSKDGTREYFSEKEIDNTSIYRTTGGIEYGIGAATVYKTYNTWHLIEIETPHNQKIEFFYNAETVNYVSKFSDSYTPQLPDSPDAWLTGWRPVTESEKQCMFSLIREKQYQLSEIKYGPIGSSSLKKVVFNKATTSRQDLTGAYALESIDIRDEHDNLIKTFDLSYTYSHNTVTTGYLFALAQNDAASHYRLMLSSVQEKDASNNTLPPYSFEYNSETLPNRFSNSKDVWGYFNGASNGNFLTLNPYNPSLQPNRAVDTLKSEAGILKKVVYPTGGYTTFTYEHNRAIPSYTMSQFLTYDLNPTTGENVGLGHLEHTDPTIYNGSYYEKEFTVTNIVQDDATSSIWFDDETNCLDNAWNSGCKFRVTVTKVSGAGGPAVFELFKGTHNISLTNGVYKLKVEPMDNAHTPIDPLALDGFSVSISWNESTSSTSDLIYGPGKRIKRVDFFDTNGQSVSSKEYEYMNDQGTSSGVLIGLPDFYSIAALSQPQFQYHTGVMAGSKTNIYQPNQVAYGMVTEYLGEKEDNVGKTVHEFTTFLDGGAFYTYPYFTPNDNEWLRGKNLSTKYFSYNQQTQLYTLEKEIINKYIYANVPENYSSVSGDFVGTNDVLDRTKSQKHFIKFPPIYSERHFTWGEGGYLSATVQVCDSNNQIIHQRTSGTQDLWSTTEKLYNDAGVIETITTHGYDYNKHYQLKSTNVTDSKGDVMETINYYPSEVLLASDLGHDNLSPTQLSAILKMRAPDTNNPTRTHQLATPVQVETKKNTNVISVVRTNFNIESSGLVLPKNVETSKGGVSLEDRIVYHSYYDNGNVKEVSKKDGTHIVYIWGYDQTVPVAKIENATSAQVDSYIAGIQAASNNDNDRTEGATGNEGALRTALTNLRNALPNALVTSFTYDPLIGVTSITDPRGRTIYYHYDSFNRLVSVKDHDGNILSENQYHYKN
ncbi:RHS repeat domain-containing protein [Flavobacteriaceae bacterium S356]|uniref:RHS repeat domain-containing protein n=1 Tax=Asprobacillus argus TaxID=3076534 RepID=A0ABU3LDH7_9FLAO|nr:RHS repeat domain-containing protein [Flavobacteriaceae bacterium S356]